MAAPMRTFGAAVARSAGAGARLSLGSAVTPRQAGSVAAAAAAPLGGERTPKTPRTPANSLGALTPKTPARSVGAATPARSVGAATPGGGEGLSFFSEATPSRGERRVAFSEVAAEEPRGGAPGGALGQPSAAAPGAARSRAALRGRLPVLLGGREGEAEGPAQRGPTAVRQSVPEEVLAATSAREAFLARAGRIGSRRV
ncbi:unnamed protein product [Prorocentrum cordatum]|uniref:Uncharacterized protein n=1 Tax=Prorocentrum cordatum TaxID=2364126 RepID=A0ABN9VVR4_9DINO|nr:unnamed protein product [Polarella glacialis]